MKYNPDTRRVERDASDKERHRQVRERLAFREMPTVAQVETAVDSLVREGLLPPASVELDMAGLAQTLRGERERQGLSLADVAQRAGLDDAAISGLETGTRDAPSLQTLSLWANALGKRLHLTLSDA